jgi:Tfp pilus assembly protein PilV
MRKYQGQGLIETLIALLIIAGGAFALIRFQSNLAYHNSYVQQKNTALLLARSKIESLKTFSSLTGANSYATISSGSSTSTINNTTYTMTWTVTDQTTYKNVNITVTWPDRYGTTQSEQLSTRIAKIDPAYPANMM